MIAIRAAIVVLAVAAIAWLGAGIAASRAQDDLGRLVATTAQATRADFERAAELREKAERWAPGRRPSLLEATLRMKGDDRAGAARLLEDIVADEPENAEAWLLLAQASEEGDPERAERAMERVRALAPDVPDP
jgi:predicted Zn-dependent protease